MRTRPAAVLARAIASSAVSPRASATPMRRFTKVCGLANRRRSTGLPGAPSASASATPSNEKLSLSSLGEDDRRRRRAGQLDRGDREAEDGAQVKLELVGELRDQRDHAGVVRARRQFGEDRLVAGERRTRPRRCRGRRARRPPCGPGSAPTAAPRAEFRPAASFRDNRRVPGGGRSGRRTARRPWSRRSGG